MPKTRQPVIGDITSIPNAPKYHRESHAVFEPADIEASNNQENPNPSSKIHHPPRPATPVVEPYHEHALIYSPDRFYNERNYRNDDSGSDWSESTVRSLPKNHKKYEYRALEPRLTPKSSTQNMHNRPVSPSRFEVQIPLRGKARGKYSESGGSKRPVLNPRIIDDSPNRRVEQNLSYSRRDDTQITPATRNYATVTPASMGDAEIGIARWSDRDHHAPFARKKETQTPRMRKPQAAEVDSYRRNPRPTYNRDEETALSPIETDYSNMVISPWNSRANDDYENFVESQPGTLKEMLNLYVTKDIQEHCNRTWSVGVEDMAYSIVDQITRENQGQLPLEVHKAITGVVKKKVLNNVTKVEWKYEAEFDKDAKVDKIMMTAVTQDVLAENKNALMETHLKEKITASLRLICNQLGIGDKEEEEHNASTSMKIVQEELYSPKGSTRW